MLEPATLQKIMVLQCPPLVWRIAASFIDIVAGRCLKKAKKLIKVRTPTSCEESEKTNVCFYTFFCNNL